MNTATGIGRFTEAISASEVPRRGVTKWDLWVRFLLLSARLTAGVIQPGCGLCNPLDRWAPEGSTDGTRRTDLPGDLSRCDRRRVEILSMPELKHQQLPHPQRVIASP